MTRLIRLAPAVLLAPLLLAGCAPTAPSGGGGGGGDAAGADCAGATTAGWDLFVDDALAIEPAGQDVYSLAGEGDAIRFHYDTDETGVTYGFQLGYLDDAGTVFPNSSGILFPDGHPDPADENAFTIEGPMSPMGVSGGPYAGIVEIDATDSSGTSVIARICVALAAG